MKTFVLAVITLLLIGCHYRTVVEPIELLIDIENCKMLNEKEMTCDLKVSCNGKEQGAVVMRLQIPEGSNNGGG